MQTLIQCLSNATRLFSVLLIMGGLAFAVPAMGQNSLTITGDGWASGTAAAGNCVGGVPSYDNTDNNFSGIASQVWTDVVGSAYAAEDFVSPSEETSICSITVPGIEEAGGGFIAAGSLVRVIIWEDNAGQPGAELYSNDFDGSVVDADADSDLFIEFTDEVLLDPDTRYWVTVAPFATGVTQWFWEGTTDLVGENTQWRNDGINFGVGPIVCDNAWGNLVDDCLGAIGVTIRELSMMVMFNSLCEFVDNEVSCIANLNVTLGDECSARITPSMVLAGTDVDCATNINITVDGGNSDIISGCGEHTYEATVTDGDGNVTYTCWGNIFAEDKTDPTIECPDDTDEVVAEFNIQTTTGTLDATDPTIELADHSCFLSLFDPVAGPYGYDLLEISVSATDVYNIIVDGDVADQTFISVFAGDFNPDNPCENILGGTEGAWAPGLFFGAPAIFNFFNQNFRIPLILEPGQTYTIMVASNDLPNDYTVGIVADNGSTVSGAGFGAAQ
ncbi:MAG: choice-of-anchor R domain-containing protein, partial [Bacteroidota bacterium]